MKKCNWKAAVAVLALLVCLVFPVACGGGETEGDTQIDYTGQYKVDYMKVTYKSVTAELNVGDNFLLMFLLSGDSFVVTLNEDGTFTLNVDFIVQASVSGTWAVQEGNKMQFLVEGETLTVDCDGKSLSMDYTVKGVEMSVILKK